MHRSACNNACRKTFTPTVDNNKIRQLIRSGMQKFHLSPHFYVAATLLTALGAFWGFKTYGYHDQLFYIPIFVAPLVWALGNLWRQRRDDYFSIERGQSLLQLLRRAIVRYFVWLGVFFLALTFYETHDYYSKQLTNLLFLREWFDLYVTYGVLYFIATLKFKASRTEDFYDNAIRLLALCKYTLLATFSRRDRKRARIAWRNTYNRKVVLNLFMRAYFIPVMVVQIYSGLKGSISLSADDFSHYNIMTMLLWISGILWFADALSAASADCIESRWVENRSRSIDLTAGGWLICLCCYAPFNQVTGTLFPFAPLVATNNAADLIFVDQTLLLILKFVEVGILAALVYSDLSLGPSGANITFKKLQDRGPYGIVRHPATTCKMVLWWSQSLLYVNFWSWEIVFGHLMWNVIYILRALSEERHLKRFPEYRAYMDKVRYRLIPGVW